MKRLLLSACAGLLLLGAPTSAGAEDAKVEVGHNRLSPVDVSIAVGEKVTFENQDEMPGGHSVAADDGSFSSPPLEKGGTWSHTFEAAGTYPYHIVQHPDAKGTISVK